MDQAEGLNLHVGREGWWSGGQRAGHAGLLRLLELRNAIVQFLFARGCLHGNALHLG